MKYPVLLQMFVTHPDSGEQVVVPVVIDLDLGSIERFYKCAEDGFTFILFKEENGYYKLALRFWDFLEKIKIYNDLDMDLEELIRTYDKGSADDFLMNDI